MIVTADLGTSKIAITVAKVGSEGAQVIYHHRTPSDGIRHGNLVNPKLASIPLKKAIEDAEAAIDAKINQIYVGLPRYSISQEMRTNFIDRSDSGSFISAEDIRSLKEIARESIELKDDKSTIYDLCAQSYSAEEVFQALEDDIVGIPSSRLEGNFKVFLGPRKDFDNIDRMTNEIKVAVADKYFLPETLGKVVLTPEEMDGGVALVEMGAGVTSVSVFQGGILRYFGSIPFGGKTITGDIKLECGFSESLAENIKLAYGACQSEKLQTLADKVLQINDEQSGSSEQLPVKYLSEIISSRETEIIDAILFLLQQSGYSDSLRQGIVLTGGAAGLINCPNLFKEMSGISIRVGHPRAKGVYTSECMDITELDAGASLAMICKASANPINCVTEHPAGPRPSQPTGKPNGKQNDKQTSKQEDEGPVDIFGNPVQDPIEPKPAHKKTERKRDGKKSPSNGIFGKIGDLFEAGIAAVYDDKEEGNNENNNQQ